MFETKRLHIMDATEADLDYIISTEVHPENRNYLWIGTREEHLNETPIVFGWTYTRTTPSV